ncbi:MAG: tetratricopeptide repeat protein [Chloroflexi bacterium]|nr:tetratricopeptide repeat protein [Chloroflexota bacterium]MCI0575907.1 tetratricopeptide repeat protein [Chloroflexota bacterium]MCI0648298.1 tetratricopeptide repeat protein [Chloroflexota bacterium]MCI0727721.1 tetratricopeptide repeat protein [Chloroflexota bacterium]
MAHIYYVCPDYEAPSGGTKTIYRHVYLLNERGLDAAVLHQQRGFRLTWHGYQVPLDWLADRPRFAAGDVLVIPESMPGLIQQSSDFPGRRVVLALHWALHLPPDQRWQEFGIEQAITPSRVIADFLAWRMGLAATVIGSFVDPARFSYRPEAKRPLIAYMPRKDPAGDVLQAALSRREELAGWEWQPLRDLDETAYAAALGQARVYLPPSPLEGLNLSVLEAMAAGCLVVGYPGVGGREYLVDGGPQQNYVPVENGHLPAFGPILADVLQTLSANPAAYDTILANALATVRPYQRPGAEADSLVAFFTPLLEPATPARRGAFRLPEGEDALALAHQAQAWKQAGQIAPALAAYCRSLELDGRQPEVWFNYGNLLQQAGDAAGAEEAYRQAIAHNPALLPAHFNLGNLLRDNGQPQAAEAAYRRCLQLDPGFVRAHTNLGNLLRSQGRPAEAADCHRRAVELAPEDPAVYFNLGNALADGGDHQAAVAAYHRSLELRPGHADTLVNLGHAQRAAGDVAAAEGAYRQALDGDGPGATLAAQALAALLQGQERDGEAEGVLEAALERWPDNPALLRALAAHWLAAGQRHEEVIDLFRRALRLEPDHAPTLNDLGTAYRMTGRFDQAVAAWEQATRADPKLAAPYTNLGQIYRLYRQHEKAIDYLQTAVRLAPDLELARATLGYILVEIGQVSDGLDVAQKLLARDPESATANMLLGFAYAQQARLGESLAALLKAVERQPSAVAISNVLFASLYSDEHDTAAIARLHRDLGPRLPPSGPLFDTWENDRDPHRPLRVAYLSPDLKAHPVGYFLEPALVHHNRTQVEVIGYADVVKPDEVTERLRQQAHAWVDCRGWPDERLATQIRADQIDILIDLAGHTAHNRAPLIARRPAPVQAAYLGYVCTSGLPAIDYLIGDNWATPPEAAGLYSERIAALAKHAFVCFQPQPGTPDVAPLPALENGYVTFGSYNNLRKFSPTTIRLWAAVLRAVHGSRLVLRTHSFYDPATRERFWDQFAAEGVERERVELLPTVTPLAAYLADYGRLDIALDPTPYTASTTTCDALWMGVPVITLAGDYFFGRMGVSVLNAAGLPELVAGSPEQFVAIATTLAGDLDRLAGLRWMMRQRLAASPLCDPVGFTRELEGLYRQMWQTWLAAG